MDLHDGGQPLRIDNDQVPQASKGLLEVNEQAHVVEEGHHHVLRHTHATTHAGVSSLEPDAERVVVSKARTMSPDEVMPQLRATRSRSSQEMKLRG